MNAGPGPTRANRFAPIRLVHTSAHVISATTYIPTKCVSVSFITISILIYPSEDHFEN